MFRLFGSEARYVTFILVFGLGIACLFSILPILLILTNVYLELVQGRGLEWLINTIQDFRNIHALTNSFLVAIAVSFCLTTVSVALAFIIHACDLTGDIWIYTLSLIPVLMPDYLVGVVGRALLEPRFGILSGFTPENVFTERFSALIVLIAIVVVKWLPLVTIIIDARISTIKPELIRQARLDFDSFLRRFQFTALPEIVKVLPLIFAFGFLIGFRQHELSIELTANGAGFSAEMWSTWNYRTIYEFFDLPSGSVQAIAALALLFIPIDILRRSAIHQIEEE
ncbi:MAG: hypothetical protein AAFZ17_09115 [Cyanobacteria bacterium J06650_10]